MAFQGFEWLIVVAVLLVLFLWGPERLPKIARAFGQAKREFEKASKEATSSEEHGKTVHAGEVGSLSDEKLLEVAKTLGISTEGKSREDLVQEIKAKLAAG
ncbi:Sec-independent protein translocase protein TatA [Candidatus Calditenuaceae archaeon HR02]|nr:Sec-independent protein translocase protein TatA [Candidatus Calditenuaceae archaeon HR02]